MLLTITLAGILIGFSLYIGKTELFLLLNVDLGTAADVFFKYITYGGDGSLWLLWMGYALFKKKRSLVPLIASGFVTSTIIIQLFKQVILPHQPRPCSAIADHSLIHFVPGVIVYTIDSFPSGHTATAFCFALLTSLVARNKWWSVAAFIVACLIGYSRIYLGQHFPLDVGAGMFAAFLSMWLSVQFQDWNNKRRQRLTPETEP